MTVKRKATAVRAPARGKPRRVSIDKDLQALHAAGADHVGVRKMDDEYLLRLGVLVDLRIGRWRAQVSINLRDLGLPEPGPAERKVFDELMNLGSKKLMPPWYYKEFGSVDSGARQFVAANTYQTRWGPWVDVGRFAEFKAGITDFENRQKALVARVCDEWDGGVASWRESILAAAAADAYHRLSSLDGTSLVDAKGNHLSQAAFVKAYVSGVQKLIPPKDDVLASFSFDVGYSYIPLPSQFAGEQAERERIEAQRALDHLRASKREQLLEQESRAQLALQDAKARKQLAKIDQTAQGFKRRHAERTEKLQMAENAELVIRRALDSMHRDVVQSAQASGRRTAAEFARLIQTQSLELVLRHLDSAAESMRKNNALIGKVGDALRKAIGVYQGSGLVSNTSVDGKINELAGLLALNPKQRKLDQVTALVDAIRTAAQASLTILKKGDQ